MMMVRNGAAVCRTGLSVSAALDGTPEYSCVTIASSSFAGAAEEAQGRLPEAGRLAPGHELRARPQTGCTSQFESM
jgi:hypothetical protein